MGDQYGRRWSMWLRQKKKSWVRYSKRGNHFWVDCPIKTRASRRRAHICLDPNSVRSSMFIARSIEYEGRTPLGVQCAPVIHFTPKGVWIKFYTDFYKH